MSKLRVLDLFSGIGGFSLGLERTGGFETVAFCEIDPFCQRVLAKHWPEVPIYDDVERLSANRLRDDRIGGIDVICGGFPCQDISFAGGGLGLDGQRSGLWREIVRLIGELRPQYALVENVAALLARGMDTVCGDLADCGYDAEWSVVSACALGAPHMRRRVFILAYPNSVDGRPRVRHTPSLESRAVQAVNDFTGSRARWRARMEDPSALYRGADGVPDRVDRNRAIGNAVAPEVIEMIGRLILEASGPPRSAVLITDYLRRQT